MPAFPPAKGTNHIVIKENSYLFAASLREMATYCIRMFGGQPVY